MKRFLSLITTAIIITSCNNNSSTDTTKNENTGDTTKVVYAYTVEHPDPWQWGTKANTQMVLNSLKAYEDGNIEESVKNFADSVKLEFDNYSAKVSKDSVEAMFKRHRATEKNLKIKMDDFESVKSNDGKYQYVSLWYKQIWEDEKGKTDSVEMMDDVRIENNKITLLNEKTRRLGVAKM
jgi:hypothetical protein